MPIEDFSDGEFTDEQLAEISLRKVKPRAKGKKADGKKTGKKAKKKAAAASEPERGAPLKVKAQLAKDIVKLGGIGCIGKGKQYSLASILATRPEIYGAYKKECASCLYYWRTKSPTDFSELLDTLGVNPVNGGTPQTLPARKKKVSFASRKVSEVDHRDLDTSDDVVEVTPEETARPRASSQQVPDKQQEDMSRAVRVSAIRSVTDAVPTSTFHQGLLPYVLCCVGSFVHCTS